jgi:hypothetical protein
VLAEQGRLALSALPTIQANHEEETMFVSNNRDDSNHTPRTDTATGLPHGLSFDITPTAGGILPAAEVDLRDVRPTVILSDGVPVDVPPPDKPLRFLGVPLAAGSGPRTFAAPALPPSLSLGSSTGVARPPGAPGSSRPPPPPAP